MLGELDDDVVAEIIATGATPRRARWSACVARQRRALDECRSPAPGRPRCSLVDIVAEITEEEEHEDVARQVW